MNPINISIFGTGSPGEIIAQCSSIQTSPSIWLFAILSDIIIIFLGLILFSVKENRKRIAFLVICFIILTSVIALGFQNIPNSIHPIISWVKDLYS